MQGVERGRSTDLFPHWALDAMLSRGTFRLHVVRLSSGLAISIPRGMLLVCHLNAGSKKERRSLLPSMRRAAFLKRGFLESTLPRIPGLPKAPEPGPLAEWQ